MSDADLADIDSSLRRRLPRHGNFNGATISERLLAATVSREIKVRQTESRHERLACISRQSSLLASTADELRRERDQAVRESHLRLQRPFLGIRKNLSDTDNAVLALRKSLLPSLVA